MWGPIPTSHIPPSHITPSHITASFGFVALAALKPVFPDNVGIQYFHGFPLGFGAHFPVSPSTDLRGGYWIHPSFLFFGMGIFVATHRGARKYLAGWRGRRLS